MAGTITKYNNYTISIKDNSSIDIVDPSSYKKLVNDAYAFLGNEEAFKIFKNVCLANPELWKRFVKAGSAMTSQMENPDYDPKKASFCDRLKSKNLEVFLINGKYFSEKFSEICENEKFKDKKYKDKFNEEILKQVENLTDAMTYAVDRNIATAKKYEVQYDHSQEIKKM